MRFQEIRRGPGGEAQLENISTLLGAAEEIELPAESFDAVICRMGLMLFAEPARAASKAWQVLKPGGRLSVLVFTLPQTNPFMAKPMQILLKHTGKQPPAPGQPGIFSLGAPGVMTVCLPAMVLKILKNAPCYIP
ncbi:MAG: methyltransferase domain-containing protein [Bacteroidetes bacterium]|nr:MAG: methyltransferase domain-containing protein [Bacteroidota bacterium]